MSGVETPEVWLVVREAVYDHGVAFVALSEESALDFCRDYAPDDDGHHNWRIDHVRAGVPLDDYDSYRLTARRGEPFVGAVEITHDPSTVTP